MWQWTKSGIIAIVLKDRKLPEMNILWNRKNTNKGLIIIALIPIQAILFATGEAHGLTDEIGVIIAILHSFLIQTIFFPVKNLKESNL